MPFGKNGGILMAMVGASETIRKVINFVVVLLFVLYLIPTINTSIDDANLGSPLEPVFQLVVILIGFGILYLAARVFF
jgi:hypothetical protein